MVLNGILACVVSAAMGWQASGLSGPPATERANALGGLPPLIEPVIAVVDIAHSSQLSANMTQRPPVDAAEWFVTTQLEKAARLGVTLVIMKHPYRWRPEPLENYDFGGPDPSRRAALHGAIAAAHSRQAILPRLCAYQALPRGESLSPADQAILDEQALFFEEDAWEAIGCKPWQQEMIDARRFTRAQHLEPVWDAAYPEQWTYPIDVTELFMSAPLTSFQVIPAPHPEIRCWFYRPVDAYWWEDARTAFVRTVLKFNAWCLSKGYTPVHPLDIYTELGVSAAELNVSVGCAGDYTGDGFVNGDDFDDFTYDFDWGSRYADLNGDGFVNGEDFDAFIAHFIGGC